MDYILIFSTISFVAVIQFSALDALTCHKCESWKGVSKDEVGLFPFAYEKLAKNRKYLPDCIEGDSKNVTKCETGHVCSTLEALLDVEQDGYPSDLTIKSRSCFDPAGFGMGCHDYKNITSHHKVADKLPHNSTLKSYSGEVCFCDDADNCNDKNLSVREEQEKKSTAIGAWQIALIVIGVVMVISCVIGALVFWYVRKKRRSEYSAPGSQPGSL